MSLVEDTDRRGIIEVTCCEDCPYKFAGHTCLEPSHGEGGRRLTGSAVLQSLGREVWCPLVTVGEFKTANLFMKE